MAGESDRGFLYCALGEDFVAEAAKSAKSVREHHEEPITLVTDVEMEPNNIFDSVLDIDNASHPSHEQIRNLSRSPYDRTIKLDTDTYLTSSVSGLFDWLHRFDIALALDPAPKREHSDYQTPAVPDSFPVYNAGVIAYRNDSGFGKFLNEWETTFKEQMQASPPYNQPSLRKTIYESDLRIAQLPCEYNCRYDFVGHATDEIKIFHGRIQNLDSYGMVKKFDIQDIVTKLNDKKGPRAYGAVGDNVSVIQKTEPTTLEWAALKIKSGGIVASLKRAFERIRS